MLDNLRGMAVFASVVKHGSFSAAAKELGITTSAVSQQIRSLENDLGVVLLHRSTRKLSLTEVGESLYKSANMMVRAAQEAKENVGQLRDEILGSIRICATPNLSRLHIAPALSAWISQHEDLSLKVVTSNSTVDMIGERLDMAVSLHHKPPAEEVVIAKVPQLLLASQDYLRMQFGDVGDANQLSLDEMHMVATQDLDDLLSFGEGYASSRTQLSTKLNRTYTNDHGTALALVKNHQGVLVTNVLDAFEALKDSSLVRVLPSHNLPNLYLTVKTLSKDQQTAKIKKCLEALQAYFDRVLQS